MNFDLSFFLSLSFTHVMLRSTCQLTATRCNQLTRSVLVAPQQAAAVSGAAAAGGLSLGSMAGVRVELLLLVLLGLTGTLLLVPVQCQRWEPVRQDQIDYFEQLAKPHGIAYTGKWRNYTEVMSEGVGWKCFHSHNVILLHHVRPCLGSLVCNLPLKLILKL